MIPLFINARDHLSSLRAMVQWLLSHEPRVEPVIIDNASTYPPLLDWYAKACPVTVIRMKRNIGPRALWSTAVDLTKQRYWGLTDPDLDLSGLPDDWLDVLCGALDRWPDIIKAGPSLEVEDLPDTPVARQARAREAAYWEDQYAAGFWLAVIDTTLFIQRGDRCGFSYGPALRGDRPYTVRHRPWYLLPDAATEEDRYYWAHATPTLSYWGDKLAATPG